MEENVLKTATEYGIFAVLFVAALYAIYRGVKWGFVEIISRWDENTKALIQAEKEKGELFAEKVSTEIGSGFEKMAEKQDLTNSALQDRTEEEREYNKIRAKGHEDLVKAVNGIGDRLNGHKNKLDIHEVRITKLESKG